MELNKLELPKWFAGEIYEKGDVISNPQTNEEIELNNLELSMYDFIMGSQMVMEISPKFMSERSISEFNNALEWFRGNNSEAYKILLD